jgi:TetR/AcrR family transcriptional repressor of mexJK operon
MKKTSPKTPAKKPAKVTLKSPVRGRPKDTVKGDDIVRAASTLFLKDGYSLTSMEAVARKADVSKLTIYSHFANKDELFKAVIQQRCDKGAMPQSFVTLVDKPIAEALLIIGSRMVEMLYSPDSLKLQRIMQAEASRHPKVVQIFYETGPKRVRAAFGDLLQSWIGQGRISIPDVARATEQFFRLLKGERLIKTLLLNTPKPELAEINQHVVATVSFYLSAYKPKSTKDMP